MTKRLFLFAGYDKDGIVDDTLIYYLSELSKLGDIVFVMDNDASETELNKIKQIHFRQQAVRACLEISLINF